MKKRKHKKRCKGKREGNVISITFKEVPVVIDGEIFENCKQLMFV